MMKLILGLTQSPEKVDPKLAVMVPGEHARHWACAATSLYVPWSQLWYPVLPGEPAKAPGGAD